MDRVDCIVVGAGVVGLAIARALSLAGLQPLVLERAEAFGTETSARNSEVIHAGLYYPPGSVRAALCVRGRDLLYAYAAERGIAHRRCGKLIVATRPEQEEALAAIRDRAAACGAGPLEMLTPAGVAALEPAVTCTAGLLSPATGIVDSHGLMLALLGEAEDNGAVLCLNTAFVAARVIPGGFEVETCDAGGTPYRLQTARLVNAAGLRASLVAAAIEGLEPRHVPQTRFARGTYYSLPGRPAFSRLVYPVPEPGGLGVHLTLDLAGGMRFGPDVDWIDTVDYRVSDARRGHFEQEIRKYWPGVPQGALQPAFCGIRPKLSGPGEPAADFRIDTSAIHGISDLVNLFGIESPGLTASLAIAECVAATLTHRPEASLP